MGVIEGAELEGEPRGGEGGPDPAGGHRGIEDVGGGRQVDLVQAVFPALEQPGVAVAVDVGLGRGMAREQIEKGRAVDEAADLDLLVAGDDVLAEDLG